MENHADIQYLALKAYQIRYASLLATTSAGSGHPTSCLSIADIMAVLFFHTIRYNIADPDNSLNDRFILSKGHAAPALYATYYALGVVSEQEMLSLRSFGSVLEGHPTPRFPYVQAATGSLGQGLSVGLGISLSAVRDGVDFYTYVLLGDAELCEGSCWEAIQLAAYYKLDHLIAIVDVNRLGQSGQTMLGHDLEAYQRRFAAFGWQAYEVDGHDIPALIEVFNKVQQSSGKPIAIIAKTFKGHGLNAGIENHHGYHGKAFKKEELLQALSCLQEAYPHEAQEWHNRPLARAQKSMIEQVKKKLPKTKAVRLKNVDYPPGSLYSLRKAFGQALVELGGQNDQVVCLDGDVKNSTFTELFEQQFPERFIQCFVAEQNMLGIAAGCATRSKVAFAATFAAFFSRAYDQIRMAAISKLPLRLCGTHPGVSIGQDGPSQMGLEDIGFMRSLPGSIVLYPSDAVSCYALVGCMAGYEKGISYLRVTRAELPILYGNRMRFKVGGSVVLKSSPDDQVCVIAAGITVHEALKAHALLHEKGISMALIDAYSIKPLDEKTITAMVLRSGKKVITVEDHYLEGGLGQAVCYALRDQNCSIMCLAVTKIAQSGSPEDLIAAAGIDAASIVRAVKKMVGHL